MPEILKTILPPVLAVALFVVAIFGVVIPSSEKDLIAQKKQALVMLIHTIHEILEHYEGQVKEGQLSVGDAQARAIAQIRSLRYGPEEKDYFWINDLKPTMIMHPYRSDLEGRDVGDFADPSGKRLFQEMVDVVKRDGAGYVTYMWQWKDDGDRIVPKISYVRLFKPWGWILGTGAYVEDIHNEIAAISRRVILISVAILAIISALSVYIMRQGLKETGRRLAAEGELRKYHEHLEELVEKRTAELQGALSRVKVLSGFLPICASCKKIRDDKGYWNQVESYIRDHSEAEFSHSICPDCARKLLSK